MDNTIPRSKTDDYTDDIILERRQFLEEKTGVKLQHVNKYSFKPSLLPGNVEKA